MPARAQQRDGGIVSTEATGVEVITPGATGVVAPGGAGRGRRLTRAVSGFGPRFTAAGATIASPSFACPGGFGRGWRVGEVAGMTSDGCRGTAEAGPVDGDGTIFGGNRRIGAGDNAIRTVSLFGSAMGGAEPEKSHKEVVLVTIFVARHSSVKRGWRLAGVTREDRSPGCR